MNKRQQCPSAAAKSSARNQWENSAPRLLGVLFDEELR